MKIAGFIMLCSTQNMFESSLKGKVDPEERVLDILTAFLHSKSSYVFWISG